MSPLKSDQDYDFCAEYSVAAGEPLAATAPRADVWLLLEYTGIWGAKAFPESDLAPAVKAHLNAALEAIGHARLLFIKKSGRYQASPIHFFVAVAAADPPRLHRFELQRYSELLSLDVAAVVANEERYAEQQVEQQVHLACVNGLRDACCAKFGFPVDRALSAVAPATSWQCSHLGGHRFAANLLFLPHGVAYGRVAPTDAPRLIADYQRQHITLPFARGRTIYTPPVQAAALHLRQMLDEARIDQIRLRAEQALGDNRWRVTLAHSAGAPYEMEVTAEPLPRPVYKTCAAVEPAVVQRYQVALIGSHR